MFQYINKDKQLQMANTEIAKLRSIIGDPIIPKQVEGEEAVEPIKLVDRVGTVEADVVEVKEVIEVMFGG